jgi:hypothetical protein
MNLKTFTLCLTLLTPFALNAMEEQWNNQSNAQCMIETAIYFAEIVNANKKQLPRTITSDKSYGFGSYTVTSTWTSDDVAKVATAKYLIKKNGTTILDDATQVPYNSEVYKPLDEGNQLKLRYKKL